MEHHLSTTISARYFAHGNPSAKTLIIALHGYGQLASYFIKKFEFLDPERYYVVAPEGLHRFYIKGTDGRVGASWMTKEDRENDIRNYIDWIDSVADAVTSKGEFDKKIMLGFSQGGATASRYIALGQCAFDALMLWSAVFPPDMKPEFSARFVRVKNYVIMGTKDPFYPLSKIDEEMQRLETANLAFQFRKFEGEHQLDADLLTELLNEI
jgi:predicted esterase